MDSIPQLELISFKLCPYVQRAVITLKHKQVDFKITYIDLQNPPEWFNAISPLGKVPVLKVNDDEVLFESSVIQEYIDEITPPSLHPADPLIKAKNRAWIAFGGELMGMQGLHGIIHEKDQVSCEMMIGSIKALLSRLELVHSGQDFFNGQAFCLIDAAYAPMLMRFDLLKQHCNLDLLQDLPKIQAWQKKLMGMSCVQSSVVAELPEMYRNLIAHYEGYMASRLN
ncbi:glutathione S-transferase family protein [Thiomicrospira microaerophila]|uniref:glutathione S-transferase family protein n=1 Tax=Thiomicrospira microaerophila TaxID=406020 RepID=UPI00200CA7A1|nr:glutathione S-transferase family protein [Thiomicrospira microaerophila]UQB41442.1 glutathione S-transferase family protein [Thiomicrospira microaerophila]